MYIHNFLETLSQTPFFQDNLLEIQKQVQNKEAQGYPMIEVLKKHQAVIDHAISQTPLEIQAKIQPVYEILLRYVKHSQEARYKAHLLQKYLVAGNCMGVAIGIELGVDVNSRMAYAARLFRPARIRGFLQLLSLKLPTAWFDHLYCCTPLILASLLGHRDIVKYLVQQGADINAQTKRGYTALDLSSRRQHGDIENYLIKQGALRNLTSDKEMEVFLNLNLRYQ